MKRTLAIPLVRHLIQSAKDACNIIVVDRRRAGHRARACASYLLRHLLRVLRSNITALSLHIVNHSVVCAEFLSLSNIDIALESSRATSSDSGLSNLRVCHFEIVVYLWMSK